MKRAVVVVAMVVVASLGSVVAIVPRASSAQRTMRHGGVSTRACLRHPGESSCDGLDPRNTPCGLRSTVLGKGPVPGGAFHPPAVGYVYLMYSPRCQTKWTRYVPLPDLVDLALMQQRLLVHIERIADLHADYQENGRQTTNMLYAPLHRTGYLCEGGATVGETAWTGYTPDQ